jgi:hypothetical protein
MKTFSWVEVDAARRLFSEMRAQGVFGKCVMLRGGVHLADVAIGFEMIAGLA